MGKSRGESIVFVDGVSAVQAAMWDVALEYPPGYFIDNREELIKLSANRSGVSPLELTVEENLTCLSHAEHVIDEPEALNG